MTEASLMTELGTAGAVARSDWAERVRAHLAPLDDVDAVEATRQVCQHVLSTASAVAHEAWPELVRAVVALSKTYAEITEEAYGEALELDEIDNDEGGALEAYSDDHLYTFDWVLTLLATPAAIAHDDWAQLVIDLCSAKRAAISFMSFGDEELCELLAAPGVATHPRVEDVRASSRAAFPFAACVAALA